MKVQICPECGTQNKEDAWKCVHCRTTLFAKTVVEVTDEMSDTAVSFKPTKLTKSVQEEDKSLTKIAFFSGALAGFFGSIIFSIPFAYTLIGEGIIIGTMVSLVYGLMLATMGAIFTRKEKLNTPRDWAKYGGIGGFVISLIPSIFVISGAIVAYTYSFGGQAWGYFFLAISPTVLGIVLGSVSGYVAGLIFRSWSRRRG